MDTSNQDTSEFMEEKKQYDDYRDNPDTEDSFLYPDQNDPNFNLHIAKQKIFQNTKYDGTIHDDMEAQAKKECSMDFEIMPHQQFVRNFMSLDTPYNSLLLYHELGTGKTCSAIGITEETRQFMKQTGSRKKIIIIASPNVRENFRSQLFDMSKLEEIGNRTGAWSMNTCVGNALIQEVTTSQNQPLRKEQIARRIEAIIRDSYTFMGYDEFALTMKNIGDVEPIVESDSQETKNNKQQKIDMIRREFDDSLIVIDEVHNIIGENKKNKKTSNMMVRLVRLCDNLRFLFLSATPMYNSHKEIVWMLNLMNLNDRRPVVSTKQIFKEDGEFVEEKKDDNGNIIQEDGKELLKRKLIGYVSYVRGENPYAFPFRVYPKLFAESEHILSQKTYPTLQMNKKTISSGISILDVYVSTMQEYQKKAYDAMIEDMNKDKQFTAMETFGYAWLQSPLSILNMVYPNEDMDDYVENGQPLDKYALSRCHGIEGLTETMDFKDEEEPPALYDFTYKAHILEKHGRIFEKEHIPKFSAKIAQICTCIENSQGIVLVYSKYIQGGLIPMALALEEMGFTRYGKAKPLFKQDDDNKKPLLDPLTMKPKDDKSTYTAKYLMITGQKKVSPNNKLDLKMVVDANNFDGKMVKVVLISEAGSEGLDFKNIRQVHILDPWYNMNRIEQTIGRAVRNRSHCKLPFEKRNVEIYMHASYLDDKEESADMYMYRLAEAKAKNIGKITRTLKETAVDCLLNIEQQNFSQDKLNKTISLTLSTNEKQIEYQVGDQPYSKNCDYMEQCEYSCSPSLEEPIAEESLVKETYNTTYLQSNHTRLAKRLRQLYRNQSHYTMEELTKELQILKPYPIEQIYYSLSLFLRNPNEWLIDKHGRKGYMILKDDVYAFQPGTITHKESSIYERSVHIDIKPKKVHVELPEPNQIPVIPDDNEIVKIRPKQIRDKETDKETDKEIDKESHSPEDATKQNDSSDLPHISTDVTQVNTIFASIDRKFEQILRSDYNKTTDKEWFLNANIAYQILHHCHKLPKPQLLFQFFHHILDLLLHDEKLQLVRHYFQKKEDFTTDLDIAIDLTEKIASIDKEAVIKNYFLQRMNVDRLYSEGLVFVIIPQERSNTMYTWKEENWKLSGVVEREEDSTKTWIETTFNKQDDLLDRMNEETIDKTDSDIGFIDVLKKSEQDGYGFKLKNVLQKKNNMGARCSEADKQSLIQKVNRFLTLVSREDEIYESDPVLDTKTFKVTSKKEVIAKHSEGSKKISKKAAAKLKIEPVERIHLCIVFEILMRYHTLKDNMQYLFSLEEANQSKVISMVVDKKSDGKRDKYYYIKK